jgi:hypothetical protein
VSGHPNQGIRKRQGALRMAISKYGRARVEHASLSLRGAPADVHAAEDAAVRARETVETRIDELTAKAYSFGLDVVFRNSFDADVIYKHLEPMARMRTTRENILDVLAAIKAASP